MIEVKGDIGTYLAGGQVAVKSCNIIIEPPKVRDVLIFGETSFLTALELFSNTDKFFEPIKEENPEFAELSSFQMLLEFLQHPQSKELRDDLQVFFSLICPQYEVEFDNRGIKFLMFDEQQQKKFTRGMINQMTCEEFGEVIKELFSAETALASDGLDYNVDKNNPQAVALEKKLREGREKAARFKGERSHSKEKTSIIGNMCSILSVAFGQTIDAFLNLTLFQLFNTFHRWTLKRQYDMYEQGVLLNPWVSKDDIKEDDVPKDWTADFYNLSNA